MPLIDDIRICNNLFIVFVADNKLKLNIKNSDENQIFTYL